jgi:hypothetical protein
MSKTDALIKAAIDWFDGKAPVEITEQEHLKMPTVNCTTVREFVLAEAVAEYLKERNEK